MGTMVSRKRHNLGLLRAVEKEIRRVRRLQKRGNLRSLRRLATICTTVDF